MSCYGCSKKYGLFCKEYGCPNCGYSYCSKCLKRPIAVPRHGDKIMNVCLICYDKLSKIQASEKVIDCDALPGTLVTKRTTIKTDNKDGETATNPDALFGDDPPLELGEVLTPISSTAAAATHSSTGNSEIDENLDCVISKRLTNLKKDNNLQSDDAIRSRLSNLTGMPQKDYSKKDILLSTDQRTDQEKMNELLEQFMGEVQIDKRVDAERVDAISDIERRLRALRGTPIDSDNAGAGRPSAISPDTNTPSDNEEEDDQTALKKIMEKYLAEAHLPDAPSELETELASSLPLPKPGDKPVETEELPWCNICNEDAVIRCKGCDGELFCAQCYRECHDNDEEYRTHIKEPFSAVPQFKEGHF